MVTHTRIAAHGVLLALVTLLLTTAVADAFAQRAGDEADRAKELYEQGRAQIRRDNYHRAVDAFRELHEEYPRSEYAGDALYWEAFALYQIGEPEDLRRALELLDQQEQSYPADYEDGDGEALAARVQRGLARQGDVDAAEDLAREAEKLARSDHERAQHYVEQDQREQQRQLEQLESDEDDDMRVIALEALMQMNARRAVPILRDVLQRRDAGSAKLREKAVFILSQKHTDETAGLLMDVARNDPDPDVREQAIFWLGQVPGRESLDLLTDILDHEKDPDLLERAVFAVAQHGDRRAHELLRDIAMDETRDDDVREQAIFWLGQTSSGESLEFLEGLYDKLSSSDLKEQVVFAVSQNGGSRGRDWMLMLAKNPDEPVEMRQQAIFWLGQNHHLSLTELEDLYGSMEERDLREQVIFAVSQMHGDEATELLIKVARSDADPDLRRQAIFWLGQTDDDRAAHFLMELINEEQGQ